MEAYTLLVRSLYEINTVKLLFYLIDSYYFTHDNIYLFLDEINDVRRIEIKYLTFVNVKILILFLK